MSGSTFQVVVFTTAFLSALILLAAVLLKGKVRWVWLFSIPVLAFIKHLLLVEGAAGSFGDWIPGRYNWEGKLLAISLWIVVVITFFRDRLETIGLTFKQCGHWRNTAFGVAVFCALSWALAAVFQFEGLKSGSISDILYQASMPTLEEELWFRGIMLAMLIEDFTTKGIKKPQVTALILAALVTSLSFWGAHSINTDGDWGFVFDVWGNLVAGGFGVLFVIVRIGTGSLVLPMLLHTWVNTAGYFL
ncbi:MAG: CPBP family glutamic-type intramembrane protease [Bacteroidota bacterium]